MAIPSWWGQLELHSFVPLVPKIAFFLQISRKANKIITHCFCLSNLLFKSTYYLRIWETQRTVAFYSRTLLQYLKEAVFEPAAASWENVRCRCIGSLPFVCRKGGAPFYCTPLLLYVTQYVVRVTQWQLCQWGERRRSDVCKWMWRDGYHNKISWEKHTIMLSFKKSF